MIQNIATSHDAHAAIPVDKTALAAFGMREVNTETFDAAIAAAGDALVCVFFGASIALTARWPSRPCSRNRPPCVNWD